MKKKWLLVGLAALVLGGSVAVAIPALQSPRPGVTKANFDRLEIGMSKVEAEAIMGDLSGTRAGFCCPAVSFSYWKAADGTRIDVTFMDYTIHEKHWTESTETLTEKLRRWVSFK